MASTILSSLAALLTKVFASVQIPSCSSSNTQNFSVTEPEFDEMKSTLDRIRAVLTDADRRAIEDLHVKMWLYDLKQVAYDLEDIIDELSYKTVQSEAETNTDEHAGHKRKFQVFDTVNSPVHGKSIDKIVLDKIINVRNRLNSINSFRQNLSLQESDGQIRVSTSSMRNSSSVLASETGIVGRDEEKNKLLQFLLNDDNGTDSKLHVFSIVAMGGMGKTTLAKLVYNDEQVKDNFQIRAWAWVSQEYDVTRTTKAIIESITREACGLTGLDTLQNRLQHIVRKEIFNHDIWNENLLRWDALRQPLDSGGRGSRILITTRNQNVARIMNRMPQAQISLNGLNPESSWTLFRHCIEQGCPSLKLSETFETIGRGIVGKCSGVPLTIRVIGGLLSSETNKETWDYILLSDIWNLEDGRDWVFDILKVSYFHLPAEIKPCYLYCALFPKGHMFYKENVVRMWAAHGYLLATHSDQMESLGYKYISELVGRSFFEQQYVGGLGCYLTMHDLIHDLARSLVRDQNQEHQDLPNIMSAKVDVIRSKYDRHFSAFLQAKALETPIIVQPSRGRNQESLRSVLLCLNGGNDDFLQVNSTAYSIVLHFERDFFTEPNVRFLRVLELSSCRLSELPHTVGNLKQLKYLGLSCTDIVRLPQAVCSLHNLQTLDLRCCKFLVELPKNIGQLQKLQHLDYNLLDRNNYAIPVCKFKSLPEGIGKLTKLQTLPVFVVHFTAQTAGVAELKDLNNLHRSLRISSLEHITWDRTCEARTAGLIRKVQVTRLCLQWNSHIRYGSNSKSPEKSIEEIDKEVLESLEPHNKIQWIEIEKYRGCSYPKWVGHPSFRQLETVIIRDFHCDFLPPLGQLPHLRHLEVREMRVTTIGSEFYGDGEALQRFSALQTLLFDEMTAWNEWQRPECQQDFPCLQELTISNCLSLNSLSLYNMLALKKLTVKGCSNLVAISGLKECWVSTKHSQINGTGTSGHSGTVDGNGVELPSSNLPARLEVVQIKDCMSLANSSLQQATEITRIYQRRINLDMVYPDQKELGEGVVLII
uniref:NB-ARC domain-containing protein n=1 Tax=Leersia perrieri TaxID=77586 RepID=A0A0D9V928_9ORYZ